MVTEKNLTKKQKILISPIDYYTYFESAQMCKREAIYTFMYEGSGFMVFWPNPL